MLAADGSPRWQLRWISVFISTVWFPPSVQINLYGLNKRSVLTWKGWKDAAAMPYGKGNALQPRDELLSSPLLSTSRPRLLFVFLIKLRCRWRLFDPWWPLFTGRAAGHFHAYISDLLTLSQWSFRRHRLGRRYGTVRFSSIRTSFSISWFTSVSKKKWRPVGFCEHAFN